MDSLHAPWRIEYILAPKPPPPAPGDASLFTRIAQDSDDAAHNTNFQSRIEYNPFQNTNISGRLFVSDAFVKLNSSPDTIGTLPSSNMTIIDAVPLSITELNRYATGTFASSLNRGSANLIPDTNDPDNSQKSKSFTGQLVLTQVITYNIIYVITWQGFNAYWETHLQQGIVDFLRNSLWQKSAKQWTPRKMSVLKYMVFSRRLHCKQI